MEARVRVAGHAVHPMLVVFPLGLLASSVVWDVCRLVTDADRWGMIAFWTIVAGLGGAVLAAMTGFIDWRGIPAGTRAKRVGRAHMMVNLLVVSLFVVSLVVRWNTAGGYERAALGAMVWGWIGIGLSAVSGWLGGELIETMGISVREGANPDSPSALGRPSRSRNGVV